MKRQEIISKLIKEGFTPKTLANFSDKQIKTLGDKILKENLKVKADDLKRDTTLADKLKDKDVTVVPEAEMVEEKPKKTKKRGFKTLDFKEVSEIAKKAVDDEFYESTSKKSLIKMVKESVEKFS